MYDDIEELAKIYDLFINGIKSFSSSFEEQYERLKYAVIADELASDFSEVDLARARILYKNDWITKEQMDIVVEIEHHLEEMNKNKSLWSTEAVKGAKEWAECREMGRKLLNSLGYKF